jgi:hypothetical protein
MSHEPPESTQTERTALVHIRTLDAVHAPAALRQSIEQLVDDTQARRARWSAPRIRFAAAGALAAGTVALAAIVLGAASSQTAQPGTPTVLAASRLALLPATATAPAESPRNAGQLERSVEGVAYPYWGGQPGWQASGARTDRLGARTITTVFYGDRRGRRIGYAIVAGTALPAPATGTVVERGGVRYDLLDAGGARIVTWRAAGHTCILAGRGVTAGTLLRLAGWQRA